MTATPRHRQRPQVGGSSHHYPGLESLPCPSRIKEEPVFVDLAVKNAHGIRATDGDLSRRPAVPARDRHTVMAERRTGDREPETGRHVGEDTRNRIGNGGMSGNRPLGFVDVRLGVIDLRQRGQPFVAVMLVPDPFDARLEQSRRDHVVHVGFPYLSGNAAEGVPLNA